MTASLILTAPDGTRIPEPTPGQIEAAARALTVDDWFIILERDTDTYLQVAVKADYYALESCTGGPETLVGTEIGTLDEVVEAFQAYARQDPDWFARREWSRVKL